MLLGRLLQVAFKLEAAHMLLGSLGSTADLPGSEEMEDVLESLSMDEKYNVRWLPLVASTSPHQIRCSTTV